jgi:hypothetical protein
MSVIMRVLGTAEGLRVEGYNEGFGVSVGVIMRVLGTV